jgi:hypothetical protein
MRTKLAMVTGFSLWMLAVGSIARAEDSEDRIKGAGGAQSTSRLLPARASETAKARAFGQQGERMRTAHEAARAAAIAAAHDAIDVHGSEPAGANRGRLDPPANSHAAKGQAVAAAARSTPHPSGHGR